MTNTIYPPDHLLRKWEELIIDEEENVDVVLYEAFQAGADQELEACCEWLRRDLDAYELVGLRAVYLDHNLRAARRPKPPSLKERALALIQSVEASDDSAASWDFSVIRRAIEALPD